MPRSTRRRALRAGALCLTATTVSATPVVAAAQAAPAAKPEIGAKRLNVRVGSRVRVTGHVAPGDTVALQVRRGAGWRTLDRARPTSSGRFVLQARLRSPMSAKARVHAPGGSEALGRLNVFRPALASWYGPGFIGRRTGCGGTLRAGQLGVANKSLPCGSKVTLRHGGRNVRVPVIDRGPYVGGREFDLTVATAQKLGFRGHGTVLVAR